MRDGRRMKGGGCLTAWQAALYEGTDVVGRYDQGTQVKETLRIDDEVLVDLWYVEVQHHTSWR